MVFDLPRSVVGGTFGAILTGSAGSLLSVGLSFALSLPSSLTFAASFPVSFGSEPFADGVGDLASADFGVPALDGGGAGLGDLDADAGGSGVPLFEAGGTGVSGLEPAGVAAAAGAGSGVPLFEAVGSGVPPLEAGGTGVPGLEPPAGGSGVGDLDGGGAGVPGLEAGGVGDLPAGGAGGGGFVARAEPVGEGTRLAPDDTAAWLSDCSALLGVGVRRADLMAGAAGATGSGSPAVAVAVAASVMMVGSSISRLMDSVKPDLRRDGAAPVGSPVSSIVSMSSRGLLLFDMNLTKATRVVLVTSDRPGLYSVRRSIIHETVFYRMTSDQCTHPSASRPPPAGPGCTTR